MVTETLVYKKQTSLFKTILLAGFIAGTIDAIFAILATLIFGHTNPIKVFWFIASGVFGKASTANVLLTADASTQAMYAIAGLLLHYFIAYCFIVFFFLIYPKISFLQKNKIVTAVVYGIFAWLVMNYIVLPAVFAIWPTYNIRTPLGVLYLIIAIGGMGAVFAGKYYKSRE